MREILFRGKRIDNGEWLEGNIIINHDFVAIMSYSGCQYWHDIIEVNSSTIGQFTGLTDKNGVKIFEGDIVEVDHDSLYGARGAVFFDKGVFMVNNVSNVLSLYGLLPWCEVIGNIHDNPELVEVSGDD